MKELRKQAHWGAFQQRNPNSLSHSATTLSLLVTAILLLGFLFPLIALDHRSSHLPSPAVPTIAHRQQPQQLHQQAVDQQQRWRSYSLPDALHAVHQNKTVIVCVVSQPYLPFLTNWLISVSRFHRHHGVLVIAEDYATLYEVNQKWPGHAVLIPPALPPQQAHKFGSQGFFNFTSRRPRHLLQILKLGYSVLYNDVDMVWLKDPFVHFKGDYDIYFMDDMTTIKPSHHSHELPPPGKKGRTYICSCLLFIRPTHGGKLILKEWIKELEAQPWSPKAKANDQPAFNWALNKTADRVKLYLLPQQAFPSGGLYFKNETWRSETHGKQTIIHNNYITGFDKKIKRFHEFNLWFIDNYDDPTEALVKFGSSKG